jgi:hypothetical protein
MGHKIYMVLKILSAEPTIICEAGHKAFIHSYTFITSIHAYKSIYLSTEHLG